MREIAARRPPENCRLTLELHGHVLWCCGERQKSKESGGFRIARLHNLLAPNGVDFPAPLPPNDLTAGMRLKLRASPVGERRLEAN